jgi:hypothetical protein
MRSSAERVIYRLLYRPTNIHFVRFAAHRGAQQTGIYEGPLAIPPKTEVEEKRYHYYECPLDPLPPIDRRTFFHYFWEHDGHPKSGNLTRESLFYNRMPKKLGYSLLQETDPSKIYGWGVHIIQGPNKPILAWFVFVILVASLLVAVIYDVRTKNADSGFGIEQWIVAVLTAGLTATYFRLEDPA